MKMQDYIVMAEEKIEKGVLNNPSLLSLADTIGNAKFPLTIVASGSSFHAALIARPIMENLLEEPIVVVTPETVTHYLPYSSKDRFNLVISQSGKSTNIIKCLEYLHTQEISHALLSANMGSYAATICKQLSTPLFDWNIGIEQVGFVTMGVQTLICSLLLIAAQIKNKNLDALKTQLKAAAHTVKASHDLAISYYEKHKKLLSQVQPTIFVGSGSLYGVAKEAALKFQECCKYPAYAYETEEFLHGPEMQLTPNYHLFILDDNMRHKRLIQLFNLMGTVSPSVHFITTNNTDSTFALCLPNSTPEMVFISYLSALQSFAAQLSDDLQRWPMHPYVDALDKQFQTKADN